jgi:lysophospholipase L1-like esterase
VSTHRFALWIVSIGLLTLPVSAQSSNNPTYLAIGDSIAFGYNPLVLGSADNFTGYPEVVSGSKRVQHVKELMNIACPGETSASFISEGVPDNGCRDYKAFFGLHTVYAGSQLSFAVTSLRQNKQISLVTISLGANDVRVLEFGCNFQPACILAGIQGVVTAYGANLAAVFHALRVDAGYTGEIVLVTYYSPNYLDPIATGGILALNTVAQQVAGAFGVEIADGFGAFAAAATPFGGNSCLAGLLIKLPDGTCNVHPSPTGRDLLADTVLIAIGKNKK